MRTMAKTALALGFLGVMALGGTAPAAAQGFYLNAPGVHLRVGAPHRHYYRRPGYYNNPGYYNYYGGGNGCPQGYTVQSGACKPYRGY
jgi:hypothetical protein